jgi:hypothetical protein
VYSPPVYLSPDKIKDPNVDVVFCVNTVEPGRIVIDDTDEDDESLAVKIGVTIIAVSGR